MSLILVFFITFSLCWLLREWLVLYITNFKIVGPWSLPLIGSIFTIHKLQPNKLAGTLLNYRQYYGETFRIWLGPKLWIFLHTPQETKELLMNINLKKSNAFDLMQPIFGNSVLMRTGKQWQQHRRFLENGFQANFIKKSQQKISYHTEIFIRNLKKTDHQIVEISERLFDFMMDTTVDIFMGKNLQIQLDENREFLQAVHRLNELFFQRMTNPILFSDIIYKWTSMSREMKKLLETVYNLMDNLINERGHYFRQQQQTTSVYNNENILLDILLEASMAGNLTQKEIREELNTLLFAGVDTTSTSLSFALYALAKNPQVQLNVYEEIVQIKGNYNADTVKANAVDDHYLNDIHKYQYLDLFLKETLRMYTTVPCTGREIVTPTKIGQHTYGAGVNIWTNFYGLCHNPKYFQEPEQFWPERFCNDSQNRLFAYLPFSSSPRICIGRKVALVIMKIFIIQILEKFHLSLDDNCKKLSFKIELVLKPIDGIHIIFKSRT